MPEFAELRAKLVRDIPRSEHAESDQTALVSVYVIVEPIRQICFSYESG